MRVGEKRKMVHVPQVLETTARRWVATYQEAWRLMEEVSQSCLERFLKGKETVRQQRKAKTKERRNHG
jgi:hypothetical protein